MDNQDKMVLTETPAPIAVLTSVEFSVFGLQVGEPLQYVSPCEIHLPKSQDEETSS